MSQDHNHLNHATWEWIAQNVGTQAAEFLGHKSWARGCFVSTVERNEEMIRAYIRNEEAADKQLDRLVAIEARVLMKSRLSSQNPL
jgi:REP element-mobilizing transposase RayT